MLKRVNLPELIGAACVLALGLLFVIMGSGYSVGTLARMGPGYFPVALGVLLILLSVPLALEVWRLPREEGSVLPWRPLLMVGLGLISFALLLERTGLVPAICALVLLSSLAERQFRPITALVIAAIMSVLGVVLFIRLLGLPLAAFGG